MNNLDLMRLRMRDADQQERMIADKRKTLDKVFLYSFVRIFFPNAKNTITLKIYNSPSSFHSVPPAKTVIKTTATADPIAPMICLTVLLIAVASSTSPDTTAIVHVTAGIKPKPAPIALII